MVYRNVHASTRGIGWCMLLTMPWGPGIQSRGPIKLIGLRVRCFRARSGSGIRPGKANGYLLCSHVSNKFHCMSWQSDSTQLLLLCNFVQQRYYLTTNTHRELRKNSTNRSLYFRSLHGIDRCILDLFMTSIDAFFCAILAPALMSSFWFWWYPNLLVPLTRKNSDGACLGSPNWSRSAWDGGTVEDGEIIYM